METSHSSISKQREIRYTDDYFAEKNNVAPGYSAVRTRESGIFACMEDPSLDKEKDYKQFKTTNKSFEILGLSDKKST